MPLMRKNWRRQRNTYVKAASEKHGEKKISLFERAGFIGKIRSIGGIKRISAAVLLLVCAAGLSALLCLVSVRLYNTAVTSDFFQTKHVDVMGNVRLGKDMVLQYSGIREGENSLSVNIADAEKGLRRTPWVEEVSIKRLLPDRFVIKLKERMPSFWVHKGGVLHYANERGDAIAPVESENFLSLPTLLVEPGAEEVVPYLSRMLKDMQEGVLPVESGVIAQVTISAAGAVEIYLEDREMRLSIATDDWSGNLARMGVALGDLARRRELQNVRQVRAASGNVWVLFNKTLQG
ncbi:MAG: FtsQ-type POTRA domain-containing protein [Desulfovibrio sp.]|jgi:cell division protein FtsQ|nr:FtsQ-type POTRA domain-containing protein [Desulfovibrio sp.]